jgi:hypothetical protein
MNVPPVENPNEIMAMTDIPEIYKNRKVIPMALAHTACLPHFSLQVKIHKPAKAAMQSATHKYKCWQISMYNQGG